MKDKLKASSHMGD